MWVCWFTEYVCDNKVVFYQDLFRKVQFFYLFGPIYQKWCMLWLMLKQKCAHDSNSHMKQTAGWVLTAGRILTYEVSNESVGHLTCLCEIWSYFDKATVNLGVAFLGWCWCNLFTTRLLGRPQPQMPLHKIQGHQNVSKRRPHHSGDICTTSGNNLKTIFSFMGQNVKKMYILGALRGYSMIRLNLSCFPAILSPISMYMWNKEAYFHIWGGITSNPGWTKIAGQ